MLCIGVFPFPSRHKRVVQSTEEESTSRRKDFEGLGGERHRQEKKTGICCQQHILNYRFVILTKLQNCKKVPPPLFRNTLQHFQLGSRRYAEMPFCDSCIP